MSMMNGDFAWYAPFFYLSGFAKVFDAVPNRTKSSYRRKSVSRVFKSLDSVSASTWLVREIHQLKLVIYTSKLAIHTPKHGMTR